MKIDKIIYFFAALVFYTPLLAFSGVQATSENAKQSQEKGGFFKKLQALKDDAISEVRGEENPCAYTQVQTVRGPSRISLAGEFSHLPL